MPYLSCALRLIINNKKMSKTQKELKNEYKQLKPSAGVFYIKNKSNGKMFISSSTVLRTVWNSQKMKLNTGWHPNKELQGDWVKFGAENFEFKIIEEIDNSDDPSMDLRRETKILEGLVLEELKPFGEKGYNKEKAS